MKHKIFACILSSILIFMTVFGGVSAMATGLDLNIHFGALALGCLFLAVASSVLYTLPKGGRFAVGLSLLALLLCVFKSGYRAQWLSLCQQAVGFYSAGYGFSMPEFFKTVEPTSHLLPLLTIAMITSVVMAWTMLHRYPSALAVFLSIYPLFPCFIVTDTVPSLWSLLMLMFGLGLVLLTQRVRIRSFRSGNRLTLILALPLGLCLMLLGILIPKADFAPPLIAEDLQDTMAWFTDRIPFVGQTSNGQLVLNFNNNLSSEVDLGELDDRNMENTPVLEVTPSHSGMIYLRIRDYDVYTGKGWESSQRTEDFAPPPDALTGITRNLQIRVLGSRNQLLIPYYPKEGITLEDGMASTRSSNRTYNYEVQVLRYNWDEIWRSNYQDTQPTIDPQYLDLSPILVEAAQEHLAEIPLLSRCDTVTAAELIAKYVSQSAEYSLEVDQMPSNASDFALWFLSSADRGYCVHFATATVVLLRAHGIPARYVEGFVFEGTAHQQTQVQQNASHAWVEYYIDQVGWVTLDATPGYGAEGVVDDEDETTSTTTTATQPSATKPSTSSTTKPSTSKDTQPTTSKNTTPAESTPSSTTSQITGIFGSTVTVSSGSTPAPKEPVPQWMVNLLIGIAVMAALLTATLIQWILRRWWKLQLLTNANPARQVIARYREAKRICRAVKADLPEELVTLAEKAGYSQHAITKEELAIAKKLYVQCFRKMDQGHWYQHLYWRFILALQ